MKYYVIDFTEKLPSGFGGTAQGPIIKILLKYKDDAGLLEHEKTHVRQWYAVLAFGLLLCALLVLLVSPIFWIGCGVPPFLHQLLYRFVRPYRRWCEVKAYRKQIAGGGYSSTEFAVTALVDKYDLGLSVDEARTLLSD
ncbi:hypothetical protein [Pseudomonas fragi]|uniref:hypothetical protein n=1 Tax=Pseudomonas fragi TaxID=296 RepID=UPI0020046A20|nr:hypothetical protein [Pseudomonas fragi]MCK6252584.1 hypothetical protein [Pseudomonas fragi]